MVVGHLRGVENAFRLLQGLSADGLDKLCVGSHAGKLHLIEAIQRLWALGIDVVAQILGVYTGIGGELLLVEALDEVQCHLCRVAELAVTVYL